VSDTVPVGHVGARPALIGAGGACSHVRVADLAAFPRDAECVESDEHPHPLRDRATGAAGNGFDDRQRGTDPPGWQCPGVSVGGPYPGQSAIGMTCLPSRLFPETGTARDRNPRRACLPYFKQTPSPSPVTREMTERAIIVKCQVRGAKPGRTVGVAAPAGPVRGFSAPVRGPSPVRTDA
jgi:hypothetical protein